MTFDLRAGHRRIRLVATLILAAWALVAGAREEILDAWKAEYPVSQSSQAECQLCHAGAEGGPPWNAYGIEVMQIYYALGQSSIGDAIRIAESFDSDGDCSTSLEEIEAGSLPGWRQGNANRFFARAFDEGELEVSLHSGANAPAAEVAGLMLEVPAECGCQPVRITGGRTLMLCL